MPVPYMTSDEFARRELILLARARRLLVTGRVVGAIKLGRQWLIPHDYVVTRGRGGPPRRAVAARES